MASESGLVCLIFISLFVWHCRGELDISDEYHGENEIQAVSGEDDNSNLEWSLDQLRALLGMHSDDNRNRRLLGDRSSADAPSPVGNYQAPAEPPSYEGDNMPIFPFGPSITTPTSPDQSSSTTMPTNNSNALYPGKKKKGNYRGIIISVSVTAAAMFALAGLLFYLYQKFARDSHLLEDQRAERPLLNSRINSFSENLKVLPAPELEIPKEIDLSSLNGEKCENLGLPACMKDSRTETPKIHTVSLCKSQTCLPPLEYSSDEDIFHSPCETPSSTSNTSISPTQQPSWESPCIPYSHVLSLSSISSPFNISPSSPTTRAVTPFSSSRSEHCSSGSPPPPPPPQSSRSPPSPPPHGTKGKPSLQEESPPPAFARDSQSSLPPLPPRPPPQFLSTSRASQSPNHLGPGKSAEKPIASGRDGTPLPKLKPLYWDKVRATPNRSMVWDRLRSGSFELDEEMIESLFGYNGTNTVKRQTIKCSALPPPGQNQRILDSKKSQNIAILLRALSVTREEVCDALLEGEGLSTELLETLVKMAPTKEEESKLKDYNGDISKLGPAERFIKSLLVIPSAFKRLDAMLYRATFEEEVVYIRKSLETLEVACKELRCSRLFLKLLEAVLKTGNRMNVGTFRGEAQAFKLDALLKLADIKGIDGKTTLLHFVVQEIIRAEGMRLAETCNSIDGKVCRMGSEDKSLEDNEEYYRKCGLQLVSGLGTELYNVRKAAGIDSDALTGSLSKLSRELVNLRRSHQIESVIQTKDEKTNWNMTQGNFYKSMASFLHEAEEKISQLQKEEDRVFLLVKEITEYFHGDSGKEEAHPLRIFVIVRDFLGMLDQVCKEVGRMKQNSPRPEHKGPGMISVRTSSQPLFPPAFERKPDSSDDESSSP